MDGFNLADWFPLLRGPPFQGEEMRVALLIEDDAVNRKLMRDILEIKFQVLEAEDADEGRRILANHIPDLIVLDVQLSGQDGFTFLRDLKRKPRLCSVPVVITPGRKMWNAA